jgi:hypothetical protein
MRDKIIEGEASDRKRANRVLRHGRPILSRGVDLTRIFFCVCRPWHRNRSGARPSSRSSKMATEYGRKSEECPTLARSVACAERQARPDGLIEVEAGVRPGPGAAARSMPARTPRRSKTTHMLKTTHIYCVIVSCLAADAALGERDVLGDARVEVMAHHQHVEMLVDRVDRERASRRCGSCGACRLPEFRAPSRSCAAIRTAPHAAIDRDARQESHGRGRQCPNGPYPRQDSPGIAHPNKAECWATLRTFHSRAVGYQFSSEFRSTF